MRRVHLRPGPSPGKSPASESRSAATTAAARGGLLLGAGTVVLSGIAALSGARAQAAPLAASHAPRAATAAAATPGPGQRDGERARWALLAEAAIGGIAVGLAADRKRFRSEHAALQRAVPLLRTEIHNHLGQLNAWEAVRATQASRSPYAARISRRLVPFIAAEMRLLAAKTRLLQHARERVKAGPEGHLWLPLRALRRQMAAAIAAQPSPELKHEPPDLWLLASLLEENEQLTGLLEAAADGTALPSLGGRDALARGLNVLVSDVSQVEALAGALRQQLERWMEQAQRIGFPAAIEQLQFLQEQWEGAQENPDPFETHERLLALKLHFHGLQGELDQVERLGAKAEETLEYIDQVRQESTPRRDDRGLLLGAQALASEAMLAARRGEIGTGRRLLQNSVAQLRKLRPEPADGPRFERFAALEKWSAEP